MRKRIIRKLRRSASGQELHEPHHHGGEEVTPNGYPYAPSASLTSPASPTSPFASLEGLHRVMVEGMRPDTLLRWHQQQQQLRGEVARQPYGQPYAQGPFLTPPLYQPPTATFVHHPEPSALHSYPPHPQPPLHQVMQPFAPTFPNTTLPHPVTTEPSSGLQAVLNEEEEVRRAIEQSLREEQERKKREDDEERRIQQALREQEEVERWRSTINQQHMYNDWAAMREEEERKRAALEEARLLQKALEESLAIQQRSREEEDVVKAMGPSLSPESEPDLSDEVSLRRRSKRDEVHPSSPSSLNVGDDELADALKLSQLVNVPEEVRRKEEQAIYRAALIHQQDREYEESLANDRMLEMKREQELAEEAKLKQEKEERKQRAIRILEAALAKEPTLPPEPQLKDRTMVSEVAVRMPDGTRLRRRFGAEEPLRTIKDWVDLELAKTSTKEVGHQVGLMDVSDDALCNGAMPYLLDGYDLVTDFPRRTFDQLDETAQQAGLCPRALLNLAKR